MEGIPPEDLAAHEANPGRAVKSQSPDDDDDDDDDAKPPGPGPSTAPVPPGPSAPGFGGYQGEGKFLCLSFLAVIREIHRQTVM